MSFADECRRNFYHPKDANVSMGAEIGFIRSLCFYAALNKSRAYEYDLSKYSKLQQQDVIAALEADGFEVEELLVPRNCILIMW